ncbi:hypothetical protein D3C87_1870660 [compost metagenome]
MLFEDERTTWSPGSFRSSPAWIFSGLRMPLRRASVLTVVPKRLAIDSRLSPVRMVYDICAAPAVLLDR